MRVTDIPNFDKLSDRQRLELAEELIMSVRSRESLPPPLLHELDIERRWADYEKNPSAVLSEEQFWKQVLRQRS